MSVQCEQTAIFPPINSIFYSNFKTIFKCKGLGFWAQNSWLLPSALGRESSVTAQQNGIARALVVGLYNIKEKRKNLFHNFKSCLPLKTAL